MWPPLLADNFCRIVWAVAFRYKFICRMCIILVFWCRSSRQWLSFELYIHWSRLTLSSDGLGATVDATLLAGVCEIWASTLIARRVAEAVTLVTPCWFRSVRPNPALRPTDADRGQFLTVHDSDGGGCHWSTIPGGPQSSHFDFVIIVAAV